MNNLFKFEDSRCRHCFAGTMTVICDYFKKRIREKVNSAPSGPLGAELTGGFGRNACAGWGDNNNVSITLKNTETRSQR